MATGLGQNGAMSQVQSWQIQCRRCGWANSGAELKCMKCGHALPYRPGMMVAGQSASAAVRATPSVKVAQPGGFPVRLVAFVIDWLILGTVWLGVWFLWQATLAPAHFDPNSGVQTMLAYQGQQELFLLIALYMLRRLYFQGSWTILGASPGMRVLNLQIVDKEGHPVGFRRAFLRYLVLYGLLSLPNLIVSPFMVAFSERKAGLHDLIAGTYVIHYLDPDRVSIPAVQTMPPGLATDGAVAGAGTIAAIAAAPPAGAIPLAQTPATAVAPASASRAPVPPPQFPVPPPQFAQPPAPIAVPPQAAAPPTDPGRDLYSPNPGAVPAPATIDYPLPFTPTQLDLPPPAPPPPDPSKEPPA